jgi:hypothetical protein
MWHRRCRTIVSPALVGIGITTNVVGSTGWRLGVTLRCGFCEEPGLGRRGLVKSGFARPNPRRASLDSSPRSSLANGWRCAKWRRFAGEMGTTSGYGEDERDAAAERTSQSHQSHTRPSGSAHRTLGRSVGGVSLGRAERSARYHRSGRVRPRNWRASLAAGPHRPVRATKRGNSIREHRVDRPDPGQGDGHDYWNLEVIPPRWARRAGYGRPGGPKGQPTSIQSRGLLDRRRGRAHLRGGSAAAAGRWRKRLLDDSCGKRRGWSPCRILGTSCSDTCDLTWRRWRPCFLRAIA